MFSSALWLHLHVLTVDGPDPSACHFALWSSPGERVPASSTLFSLPASCRLLVEIGSLLSHFMTRWIHTLSSSVWVFHVTCSDDGLQKEREGKSSIGWEERERDPALICQFTP